MNDSVVALLGSAAPISKLSASKSECYEFSRAIGLADGSQLLALYTVTDGYSEYDKRNDIRLWSKAEILEAFRSKEFSDSERFIAFSDFMLNDQVFLYDTDSENVCVAFENGSNPITFSELIDSVRDGALPSIV